jgi:hypothetical protein
MVMTVGIAFHSECNCGNEITKKFKPVAITA